MSSPMDEAENWRGNYILLANTINPEEDKPALLAAQQLVNRIHTLEAERTSICLMLGLNPRASLEGIMDALHFLLDRRR